MASQSGLQDTEWEALYRRLERPLYNLAYRYVWNREEGRDIVHDAFLQLWVRRRQMRAETADRYVWIAVLNRARNHRRWRRTKEFIRGDAIWTSLTDGNTPADAWHRERADRELHEAIEALPEKLRAVLLLTEFSELSHADVAQMLRIPTGTVASRRHSAIHRLERQLQENLK